MTTQPASPDGTLAAPTSPHPGVFSQLSMTDRFLSVWILLAMLGGLFVGRILPDLADWLDHVKLDNTSLPIALGLFGMMYPVFARVRYERLRSVTRDTRFLALALVLVWVVAPLLMFTLAWIFLPDSPEYRTGIILIGIAPCLGMVLVWNRLAGGDEEAAAVLLVVNAAIQVLAFPFLAYFYAHVLPGLLGLEQQDLTVRFLDIARSVLIFLGGPLLVGFVTQWFGRARRRDDWYDQRFLPRMDKIPLLSLLFTIVVMFAVQGDRITNEPGDVARIALPLVAYFAIMWTLGVASGRAAGYGYPRRTALAFTAAGNNFELAIAVAIATFGVTSKVALAGTVGPLIEVPALVFLVYVALWLKDRVTRGIAQPAVLG